MERDVETRGESSTAHIHTHTQTYICIYYRDKRNKRGVRVSEEGVTAIWESNIFDLTAFLCRNIRNCGRVIDGQRQFRTGRSLPVTRDPPFPAWGEGLTMKGRETSKMFFHPFARIASLTCARFVLRTFFYRLELLGRGVGESREAWRSGVRRALRWYGSRMRLKFHKGRIYCLTWQFIDRG